MNRQITIPRDQLEPFLKENGFYNSSNSEEGPEVTFSRMHHLNRTLSVKIFTTIPLGGTKTYSKDRQAILVRGLGPKGVVLSETKILRVNSVKSTLQRILVAARKSYKALNEYYKENLKDTAPPRKNCLPAPQMVNNYLLGQINGLCQAIYLLRGKAEKDRDEYGSLIRRDPQSTSYYLERLINDQILCLQQLSRNLIPEVQ